MLVISLIITAVLVALDQGAKYLAVTHLAPVGNLPFLPGFINLTYVQNQGAAFGMLSGKRWFFVILTVAVAIAIIIAIQKLPRTKEHFWVRVALVLILSGAIGNLIDRAGKGYVVDFFEFAFIRFPVFNVADIFVVVGTALLAVMLLFVIKDEK